MKLKNFMLIASIIGAAFHISAQNFIHDWGYAIGGAGSDVGTGVTTDMNGDVIHVGNFSGTMDADPGTGTTNLISNGGVDISICKYDPDGNLIWAKNIGGALNEESWGIATASDGSIYVSGGYRGTADFDPGTGTQNETVVGDLDIFLLKLDANGDFQWVYTAGSVQGELARDVEVDHNDDVYLTGSFRNTVDFDSGMGTFDLISEGGSDCFLLKLDPTGAFLDAYQYGGTLDDQPLGVTVDNSNNVYTTGGYNGTIDLDVLGTPQSYTSAGGVDIFLLKLNDQMQFEWAHSIGSTGTEDVYGLETDNSDNVIIGGSFRNTVDFDPDPIDTDIKTSVGGADMMLVKFDFTGDYIWSAAVGAANDDQVWGISVDKHNSIYASGFFRFTIDFDPGAGTANVATNCACVFADQFIWKLDENGQYLYAESMGGTNNDHSLDVHANGDFVYLTGYLNGSTDLDITTGTNTVVSNGSADYTFSKHTECNPTAVTDVIVSCDPITWIDGNTYSADNNTATMMLTNQYGCDSLVTLDFMLIEIADQTVTPSDVEFCDNGTPTFDLGSSESGVFYSLVDQSNGNVIDGPVEGNGSALTLNGSAITATTDYEFQADRNKNNSLTFTGNSATPTYVSLGNEMNKVFRGTDQITAEAWVNTSSPASLQTVVGNYGDFGNTMQFLLRLDQAGGSLKASFWVGVGPNPGEYVQVAGTTTINQNTWYHIAGTFNGSELAIYVDGVLENTVQLDAKMPDVTAECKIGGGLSNNTEFFNGKITGVRLWNVVRTETEINTDKDQCIAGNTAGLVAMYNMIDGVGSATLTDESVNGYNGTLTNMDINTSWGYTDLPAIACQVCSATMTQTPTVTVNNSTTGTDVQTACGSYTWIDGNEYTASNNTATFTLTNAAGCDSLVTLDLTIETTPAAGAVDNGDGTLSATGTGTYQWIDCADNTPIVGATSSLFTPSQNGDYKVVVSDGNCSDTSDCVTINNVSLNQYGALDLSAYPNPTESNVTIVSTNVVLRSVSVHDATGRLVVVKSVNSNTTSIDLQGNENGLYFINVESIDGNTKTLRIVKQ